MTVKDLWISGRTGRPTSRYGRGKRWRAWWSAPDGTRRSKAFASRAVAAEYAAAMATDTAVRRASANGDSATVRALLAQDGRTPLAVLRDHRGPVEVFLTQRGADITARVYGQDEECLAELVTGSASLRGAGKEITALLLGKAYEPTGRWTRIAGTQNGAHGETMRAFQRKQAN